MTEEDFTKVMGEKPRGEFKKNRLKLNAKEKKAIDLIDTFTVFTFDKFKKQYLDDADYSDLFAALEQEIKKIEKERPGTASSLQSTLKSWKDFYKHASLPFSHISVKLLYEYETHMRAEEKSMTTIGIYMRNIRRMFNLAIDKDIIKEELYPFGKKAKGLYEIPESENFKRALPKSEIRKIFDYEALEGSPEQFYRDLWLFSYLCNGMNLADIARLKYKDIQGGIIVFIRKKTAHGRRHKPIVVEITPEVAAIIDRWGNSPASSDSYVFNILKARISPADELARVKQLTKQVNKYIGRIATTVGIEGKITSYAARHSFASVLKQSGESTVFIQEALGHKDLKTTENYLISFDSEHRKKAQKSLTNWND
jgi:integrase